MTSVLDPRQGAFDTIGTLTGKPAAPPPKAAPPAPVPVLQTPEHPTLPTPTGPPITALATLGWHGSIHDFNAQVATIHAQELRHNGVAPSPSTMLQRAIAPAGGLPGQAPQPAFDATTPLDQAARIAGATPAQVTRADGVTQQNTPFYNHVANQRAIQEYAVDHPALQMGMLPIPSFGKFIAALNTLNAPDVSAQTTRNTYGMNEFQQGVEGRAGTAGDMGTDSDLGVIARQGTLQDKAAAVKTVKQAQIDLNQAMGTTLPTDGVLNGTWVKTISNWMKTVNYAQTEIAFQAKAHGMTPAEYERAFKNKAAASKPGLTGHIAEALPIQLFSHGNLWDNVMSVPSYIFGSGGGPLNVLLHSLTRSAGLTLDTIGGVYTQGKADAAAITTIQAAALKSAATGKAPTYDEVLKNANEQLHANPTWLRVLLAGRLPVEEGKWLKEVDTATNLIGDVVFLRKPRFTGETVAPGDVGVASRSTYLNTSAKWAYRELAKNGQDGIGRAAARLEGGQGARALVARTWRMVQSGEMTEEQFAAHVAELYATGQTEVLRTRLIRRTPQVGAAAPVVEPTVINAEDAAIAAKAPEAITGQRALPAGEVPHVEPPVPAGHVRLYRGEGETAPVGQDAKDFYGTGHAVGGWFTDSLAVAREYARRNKGQVHYVDVPESEARPWARARESDQGQRWTEYRFPDDSPAGRLARETKQPISQTAHAAENPPAVRPTEVATTPKESPAAASASAAEAPPPPPIDTSADLEQTSVMVRGPLLDSLRSDKLPTPGRSGMAWLHVKEAMRQFADTHATSFAGSNNAADFITSLRSAVAHYVSPSQGFFDRTLPEGVFNFIIHHKLGDDPAATATMLESRLVRFQGTQNVKGIQAVQRKVQALYHERYPDGSSTPRDDPFNALIGSEAPSVFKFPGGGEKEVNDALGGLQRVVKQTNNALNRIAKIHGRIILSGLNPAAITGAVVGGMVGGPAGAIIGYGLAGPGMSLFWKHAVGDTLRAEVGGGGFLTSADPAISDAKREIADLAKSDPEVARQLGVYREKAIKSEANWAMGHGMGTESKSFTTADKFGDHNYMTAAGGFLRRHVNDPALDAYIQGAQALNRLVLNDPATRGMWRSFAAKAKAANPADIVTSQDYAALIAERYRGIEEALARQGLNLNDARDAYHAAAGKKNIDAELGKWIEGNGIDMKVYSGQVPPSENRFDAITSKWIGSYVMAPNKWNRGRFADNVLAKTYSQLRKAGFEQKDALETATSVASALTRYHMLDFANRLQVEQDLRWISYFATKHRLYWKWVIGTFLRTPGYAATVYDFQKTLDSSGGKTLPIKIGGKEWTVPLERLVWVPGREYNETSPLAQAVFTVIQAGGTLDFAHIGSNLQASGGNLITRSDVATTLGTKLLKVNIGLASPTYAYATAGLTPSMVKRLNTAMNEYQLTYEQEHGRYAPESQVVKSVLLHQLGEEYWRANMPLPVVPKTDQTAQDKLLTQFMLLDDPKKRAQFMNSHPGFSDHFGVNTDPNTYLMNRTFFARWVAALDAYHSALGSITKEYTKTGVWTPEMTLKKRALGAALGKTHDNLLTEDARRAGIETHGQVPDGDVTPYGPWGALVAKDPVFDVTHALNTMFPKLHAAEGVEVMGPIDKQNQNELDALGRITSDAQAKQHGYQSLQEVKTRRGELIQKVAVFKSFPTTATAALYDKYQTVHVAPYWDGYNKRYNAAQAAPSAQRKVLDAQFRAWRDEQDHPVTVDGIKFPSPVRMAWATLDPVTRKTRLSYLSSKPLADVANYELDLLGVKHPPNVSTALSALAAAEAEYRRKYPTATITKDQRQSVAVQIDKQPGYHGFLRYWNKTLNAPRVKQFEDTNIYTSMPPTVKEKFDQIAKPALKASTDSGWRKEWKAAVDNQIVPWLSDPSNSDLREYLAPMGPNFLYTLPSN